MKNLFVTLTLIVAATISTLANANDALIKKYSCNACHSVDAKVLGPAFKEVAKSYAGKSDAQASLVKTITSGSVGKWGSIPMPATSGISEEDAKALAAYVLSLMP